MTDQPKTRGLLKRCSKRCNQCLFSENKIVSDERKAELIAGCIEENVHFSCHKFTILGEDVACRGFLEAHPFAAQAERMAHAFARTSDELTPYEDLEPPKGLG